MPSMGRRPTPSISSLTSLLSCRQVYLPSHLICPPGRIKSIPDFVCQRWWCPSSSHSCISSTFPHLGKTRNPGGDGLDIPLSPPFPIRHLHGLLKAVQFSPSSFQNHCSPKLSLPDHPLSLILSAGRNSKSELKTKQQEWKPVGASCYTVSKRKLLTGPWQQSLLPPAPPLPLSSPHSSGLSQVPTQGLHSGTPLLPLYISDPTSLLRWALLCLPIYLSPLLSSFP